MNLAQFQIILQKINALDKNILMDGKISSIEKDLMKAYVSQLYEACVSDNPSEAKLAEPKVAAKAVTPPPPVAETPVVEAKPIVEAKPVVEAPVQEAPVAHVQAPAVPSEPVTAPAPQPVQQEVETPAPIVETTPVVTPEPQAQNKLQDLNDRIAANTKTVADKLAAPQGKSLNDRLANTHKSKTFNDKFTAPEPTSTKAKVSAPKMVHIPDSIKHLDNTDHNKVTRPTPTPPVTPEATVTPPPPPAPKPVVNTPIVNTPVVASVNINEVYSLFDDEHASESAGKWGSTSIQDLNKSIGLNDKISMIKELFNDDHHAFNNALTQLNGLGDYNEAKDYMMRNLVTVFKWNEGSKLERAKQLINLVRRRYK